MATIRYGNPYEVKILAKDLSSLKSLSTTFYLINAVATGASPGYGNAIAGSSTTTLLGNFKTAWEALILLVGSVKYQMVRYEMRAITGYGYQTPVMAIVALTASGTLITVQTAVPHGLTLFDTVQILGVTTPAGANGIQSITVTSPNTFTYPSGATGAWTGPGTAQKTTGQLGFTYVDAELLLSSQTGNLTGDTLPLYADVDVRRINPGVGKSFRSRFSIAPVAESLNDFGKLNAGAITTFAGALASFNTFFSNGGADATAGKSYSCAVSKKLGTLQPNPFTTSTPFVQIVSSYLAHANLGTQMQRKVKLTGS